jgi:hypothetical protein
MTADQFFHDLIVIGHRSQFWLSHGLIGIGPICDPLHIASDTV